MTPLLTFCLGIVTGALLLTTATHLINRKPKPWHERPTTLCRHCQRRRDAHGQAFQTVYYAPVWRHATPFYCDETRRQTFAPISQEKQFAIEMGEPL